jgi:FMN phosphatase YigB (HAD superfamily)
MPPCLLLDIDGVILRDRLLLAHVKHNATRYVKKKLPECDDPAETNRILYLAHGHTARGLRDSFGLDVSDYNNDVYDKSLMTHLAEVLETEQFIRDAEKIHELTNKGWPVTLFSNAPHNWCAPVALAISDQIKIRCPGPDMNTALMKPDPNFYREFDNCKGYYYVDDSLENIGATRGLANWRSIYFTEEQKEKWLWCPQVQSIDELVETLARSVK